VELGAGGLDCEFQGLGVVGAVVALVHEEPANVGHIRLDRRVSTSSAVRAGSRWRRSAGHRPSRTAQSSIWTSPPPSPKTGIRSVAQTRGYADLYKRRSLLRHARRAHRRHNREVGMIGVCRRLIWGSRSWSWWFSRKQGGWSLADVSVRGPRHVWWTAPRSRTSGVAGRGWRWSG